MSAPVQSPNTPIPWRRHAYTNTALNAHSTDFLAGANPMESLAITSQLGRPKLTRQENATLQTITGCRHFGEFKYRVLSTHPLIDHDASMLMVDHLDLQGSTGTMTFSVYLRLKGDSAGAGKLVRHLDHSTSTVSHRLMHFEDRHHRQGLATHISQSQEEAWAAAGYQIIRLTAAKSDGWKHWARQGYDFDPATDAEKATRNRILDHLDRMDLGVESGPKLKAAIKSDLRESLRWPAPSWELLRIGDALHAVGFIMPRAWEGIKLLHDTYPGHMQAMRTRAAVFQTVPIDLD